MNNIAIRNLKSSLRNDISVTIASRGFVNTIALNFHLDIGDIGDFISGGSFGAVFKLITSAGKDNVYVVKYMKFNTQSLISDKTIFMNEISVGSNKQLYAKETGPVIYTYSINDKRGLYIMDNVLRGEQDSESIQLSKFIKAYYPNAPPSPNSQLIKKLKQTLLHFYNLTKGYHGDLHTGNIAVIINKNTHSIKRVMIYDYGAHRKFTNFKTHSYLSNVLQHINNEWRQNGAQIKNQWPARSGVYVKNTGIAQPFRSNKQMLMLTDPRQGSRARDPLYGNLLKPLLDINTINKELNTKKMIITSIANISHNKFSNKPFIKIKKQFVSVISPNDVKKLRFESPTSVLQNIVKRTMSSSNANTSNNMNWTYQ